MSFANQIHVVGYFIIVLCNPLTDASHDPPEIHCVVPHFASIGDQVAIIGTRMHSREFNDESLVYVIILFSLQPGSVSLCVSMAKNRKFLLT